VICCSVSVLCQVDVESFHVLRVVIISRPEQFDRVDIMSEGVQFPKVEIVSDTEVNKDMFVLVELFE
jgi:hypothetical protein